MLTLPLVYKASMDARRCHRFGHVRAHLRSKTVSAPTSEGRLIRGARLKALHPGIDVGILGDAKPPRRKLADEAELESAAVRSSPRMYRRPSRKLGVEDGGLFSNGTFHGEGIDLTDGCVEHVRPLVLDGARARGLDSSHQRKPDCSGSPHHQHLWIVAGGRGR